jgi:hypothetical protein
MADTANTLKPAVVWMTRHWDFKHNPFPGEGIARLGGEDERENGLLFSPRVQRTKIDEAIEKFLLGAAFSGLRFGYLWSLGTGLGADQRGFGKSSVLQYLVDSTNADFGRGFFLDMGLDEADAEEHATAALLASFDMDNARSLAAVFFQATHYACRFRAHDNPTLAERLRLRLEGRVGSDQEAALVEAVVSESDNLRGRTIGPPNEEFIVRLCAGDPAALARFIDGVKAGSRARVGAANYLATFLLFAKAAGIRHVLLGCDQLEDFAATSTTKQKRSVETERFRDYVLELQPMADMLSTVVTLHPRAANAIGEMWRLADLPNFAPDRAENQPRIVILEPLKNVEQTSDLLRPYLQAARKSGGPPPDNEFAPFGDEVIGLLLERSHGKPREVLRKANALIERGARDNLDVIDGPAAAAVLDSLTFDEDEEFALTVAGDVEDQWAY